MHLLTLLIAAVFSSSFVAPNDPIVSFTLTPATLAPAKFADTPEFTTDLDTSDFTAVTGFISALEGDTTGVDLTATEMDGTGDFWKIKSGVNLSPLLDDDDLPASVWVHLKEDTQTPAIAVEVKLEKPFGFTSEAVDEDAFAITTIEVTRPIPDWNVTSVEANDKVTVYIAKEEVAPAARASYTWIGTGVSAAYANNKYEITSLDIHAHTLTKEDTIYVYVSYVDSTPALAWADGYATIEVDEAEVLFTITTPAGGEIDIAEVAIAPLIIEQKAGSAPWTKANAKLKITLDPEADPAALPDVEWTTDATLVHTLTSYSLGRLFEDETIFVYVNVKNGDNWRILKKHQEIEVTGAWTAPTFEVKSPAKIIKSTMATFDIVVKQTDATANVAAWETSVAVFITPTLRLTPTTTTAGWKVAEADGDGYKASITLSDLSLTTEDKVYVWVRQGMTTEANGDSVLPVPVELAVQADVDPTFSVGKPTAITEEELAAPIAFEITPIPADAWASKTVVATISTSKNPPGATPPYTETLAVPTGSATAWTASFDLGAIDPATITDGLFVHVKVADAAYDQYVARITFTPKAADPFVVNTPTAITEAALATPIAFELTPVDTAGWAAATVLITIALNAEPITAAEPPFTETLVVAQSGTKWTATVNLATLAPPANQAKLFVHVKVGAAYLSHVAEITYTPGSAPDPTIFVLDPATVKWAADVKLVKTEIKPTPEAPEDWPTDPEDETMKFEISNPAAATVEAVKGVVAIEVDEDEETVQWFIPANTDIHTLVADEPTANVPLTVRFTVDDGTTWVTKTAALTVTPKDKPAAAMGVSPLLSLLAALVFLFVKLF